MKKILLSILFLFVCALVVSADNWVRIDKYGYIEADSIKDFKFYGRPNTYSVWVRRYNDKSDLFKVSEKNLGEKIKYFLIWDLYDCNNKETAVKDFYIYDMNEKIIFKSTDKVSPIEWESVGEKTYIEKIYNKICLKNKFKKASF